jgi:curved DNA-binding protein CbpA
MQGRAFIDFYEILQVSPTADTETIHRVYRILAQRFHPDNRETGSEEIFRTLSEAYSTLGEPEKRAAYDVRHREERRLTWRIFDQSNAALGVDSEKRKRHGILQLLYRKRLMAPEQPAMTLHDFEELLGVPKEHLEFPLWYLREGQFVQRTDSGRHSITLKGVDLAETLSERREAPMLLAASRAASPANVRVVQR